MGMAPVAHVLFSRFLNCNPKNSTWLNRDRFVLSNGHGCALQYILLHLLGYKVGMEDLKQVSVWLRMRECERAQRARESIRNSVQAHASASASEHEQRGTEAKSECQHERACMSETNTSKRAGRT